MLHALGMIVLGLLLGLGRHRRQFRRAALHLRHPGAVRRHRLRRRRDGHVRHRRDHRQPRARRPARADRHEGHRPDADARGLASASSAPILRGTALGSLLGILPGGGATLASFGAYALEKKLSKNAGQFGNGAIEGVAAPESANNAGAQTSFIPMLTLGIPANPVMALMVGAMIIQGIQPGPSVMTEQPALFWGLIASMWIGNLMLLVLNLPLIGLWVRLISMPYHLLFPMILVFCAIGVFSLNNSAVRHLSAGRSSASSAMSSRSSTASRRRCCWALFSDR